MDKCSVGNSGNLLPQSCKTYKTLHLVAFAPDIIVLLFCVAAFSIGSSLQSAPQQVIVAQLAKEHA
jgi:hypothetical protein